MTVTTRETAERGKSTVGTRGEAGIEKAELGGFTAHMVTVRWTQEEGWSSPETGDHRDLLLSPATAVFHYGQSVIEGLKAHRQPDGSFAVFRPRDHARRMQQSARRLAMPALPEELFVSAVEQLVAIDGPSLSARPGHSFYLRPFQFASEANLVPRPARECTVVVIAFPIGSYFGADIEALTAWVCRDYPRAFPGGTGSCKTPGNYAPTMPAQESAAAAGAHQVVWLDAVERRWVEEMGSANLFFVRGAGPDATVVTPPLTGSFLAGVTRQTVMTVAAELGLPVTEEPIAVDQWRDECQAGLITETLACGTAAVVTSIGRVLDGDDAWTVGDGTAGPVARAVRARLVEHHRGLVADPHGWRHPVPAS